MDEGRTERNAFHCIWGIFTRAGRRRTLPASTPSPVSPGASSDPS